MATSICTSSEDFPEVTYCERLGGNTWEVAAGSISPWESLSRFLAWAGHLSVAAVGGAWYYWEEMTGEERPEGSYTLGSITSRFWVLACAGHHRKKKSRKANKNLSSDEFWEHSWAKAKRLLAAKQTCVWGTQKCLVLCLHHRIVLQVWIISTLQRLEVLTWQSGRAMPKRLHHIVLELKAQRAKTPNYQLKLKRWQVRK